MEVCAMKHNFDYKVGKSDKTVWYVCCADDDCGWRVRTEGLTCSSYFIIKKYVPDHSCSPSSRNHSVQTASSKTVGSLITHKYESVKEGPKPNDIIQFMRNDHGVEISYSLAWDAREYAINAVRGIPEKGYEKIPKYLQMMKEANPGTHTFYETDNDGRFRFLFISYGQSIRGFYAGIRKVIVVHETFSKSKYKGILLVATTLDAFVSDRNTSIAKALAKVYPYSHHGICIHHLLNNVVTYFKSNGVSGLVAKASKSYRVADFKKMTTNPAESINSALHSPREFPVRPLLDSIREMMTHWFFKRKTLSFKYTQPLTIVVEKKIDRRIEKDAHVQGGKFDLMKILCMHAIKAAFSVEKQAHTLTDDMYTTASWRSVYEETINPTTVPEDS
ncbi:uncharacterized protein LOC106399022 [Brassica napus]|uniref:uncharacterized protein LOC106399022 n=1 Tax=Brassica napus TaxID=3708 RepID=UPI0006AB6953|nr:uncharacterized protein LOC106399022 [Brassica napus]